jgi:hypothetical protein
VTYDYWLRGCSNCITTHTGYTENLTLNGAIDPAQSTGGGQIKWTKGNDWGVWQAPQAVPASRGRVEEGCAWG